MAPRKGRDGADGVGHGDVHGDVHDPIAHDRTTSQNAVPALATPMRSQDNPFIEASGSLTRRMTRSMTKSQSSPLATATPGSITRLQERLRSASSKNGSRIQSSNLEESRTITYNTGNRDEDAVEEDEEGEEDEDDDDEEEEEGEVVFVAQRPVTKAHSTRGRILRGTKGAISNRLATRKKVGKTSTRDSTPSDTVTSAAGDGDRPRKKRRLDVAPRKFPVRRSVRLAKPLTVFHMYPYLPIELQMMIWEAAITPRLVYLRNMYTLPPTPFPTIQNKIPPWFMACRLSLKVALHHYRNMFPLARQNGPFALQPINPEIDVVLFEPCCNGCRAKNCASRNFSENDRGIIRKLAVQTDSPYLMPSVQPAWASITDTWPKVDTIYLLKTAIKGDDRREKAMIRTEEGPHESNLRKKFEDWKKGVGKDKSVQRIEFATIVEKENDATPPKDRYKSIQDRKTDLPEDIIVG